MNLSLLTLGMMLNTTETWLEGEEFCKQLKDIGPLGVGVHDKLDESHQYLAEVEHKREQANAELSALGELIVELDHRHDRKARSAYHHCGGLAEGADDPEDAREYEAIQRKLFPKGLRVVRLPFVEEGGAAVVLAHSLTPKMRAKIDAIVLGKYTLGQLVDDWLTAGHELGKAVARRSALRAALKRDGSATAELDVRKGRTQWIRAVKGLLWALDAEPELEPLREPIEATLRESIDLALARRDNKDEATAVVAAEAVDDEGESQDLTDEGEPELDQDEEDAS